MCDFTFFRENYEKLKPFLEIEYGFCNISVDGKKSKKFKDFTISYIIDIFNNIEKYSFMKESKNLSSAKNIYNCIYNMLYEPYKLINSYNDDYKCMIEKIIILEDLYKSLKENELKNLLYYFETKHKNGELPDIITYYDLCYEENEKEVCKIYNFFVENIKTLLNYNCVFTDDCEGCNNEYHKHVLKREILDKIIKSLKFVITNNYYMEEINLFNTFLNMDLNEENIEFLHKYENKFHLGVEICLVYNFTDLEKKNMEILFRENLLEFVSIAEYNHEENSAYGYILDEDNLEKYYFLNNEFFMKYIDPSKLNEVVKEYCMNKFNVFGNSKRKSLFLKYVYNELDSEECSEECELIKINEEGMKFNVKLKIKDEEYILPGDNQCLIHHGYITNINALCILDCGHILCSKCFDKNKGKCVYKDPHEFLM